MTTVRLLLWAYGEAGKVSFLTTDEEMELYARALVAAAKWGESVE